MCRRSFGPRINRSVTSSFPDVTVRAISFRPSGPRRFGDAALGHERRQAIIREAAWNYSPLEHKIIPVRGFRNMSRRSRAREVVVQVLYEDDLNPDRSPEVAD